MSTWEDKIGDFKTLTQKAVFDNIGHAAYLYILARRAGKHAELCDHDEEYETYDPSDPDSVPRDPYFRFETLDQVLTPKTKPPKKKKPTKKKGEEEEEVEEEAPEEAEDAEPTYYTYNHSELKPVKDPKDSKKTLKDKDGKVVYKIVEGEQKVKKFATIGMDAKKWLTYIFNKYLKEIHDCFENNGRKFSPSTEVVEQVCTYVRKNYGDEGIAPFIVAVSSLVPVDTFIDDSAIKGAEKAHDLNDYLLSRTKPFFKGTGKNNQAPNNQLSELIERFVTFLKVVCCLYMESIWGKSPGAMHIEHFQGIVRLMYMLLSADEKGGYSFQYELYEAAAAWVSETEEAAKKERASKAKSGTKGGRGKKKKDEDADEEDNEEDVDAAGEELADEAGDEEQVEVDE
jgi:hypothetical protein